MMISAPLLGYGARKRTTLRGRRRLATCAYVATALATAFLFARALSGPVAEIDGEASARVQVPWRAAPLDLLPTGLMDWGKVIGADSTTHSNGKPKAKAKPKPKAVAKKVNNGGGRQDVLGVRPDAQTLPPTPHAQDAGRTFQPHTWRPDGLLEVNPDGRHPIFDLMERAQSDWDAKLARQSKSLDEAVTEYRRRYGRAPPKGFDRWWDYVEQHNVLLPDEYDIIHHDLEPYYGISPRDFRALESEQEAHPDSWTMGKAGSHGVMLMNMSLHEHSMQMHLSVAYEMLDTLKPVQDHLPHFRAVFNPHDNPYIVSSHDFKEQARAAAREGTYLDLKNLKTESEGWRSACSRKSPARMQPYDLDKYPKPSPNKTFIYEHFAAMDPCLHPQMLHQHGQFLAHEYGPGPLVPQPPGFSYSTSRLHSDLRIATPFNWVEDVPGDTPWSERRDDRLLWRGTNTGIWHAPTMRYWRQSHRERLVAFADQLRGNADVLVGGDRDEGFRVRAESVKRLNDALLDLEFAGEPNSCEDSACVEMRELFEYVPNMDWHAAGEYKFVMDIDGNGWSSRFKRLITSNALVFKATAFPEWFVDRVQPWVHYVPIQLDFSDLYDSLVFFRGDAQGRGAHDADAARIAREGTEWSKRFWRKEDLTAYNFRLMLEYARLMAYNREEASYHEPEEGSW